MTDDDSVRRALRCLASTTESTAEASDDATLSADHVATIDRATAALEDIEAAAAFVAEGGLDDLERAVDAAADSVSDAERRGRDALDAYERFRAAAAGDHFHPGRGTSLGDDTEARTR